MKTALSDTFSRFFLFLVPLTLPLAQYKAAVFGIPFYVPEMCIVIALAFRVMEGRELTFRMTRTFLHLFFWGGLFLLGAAISLAFNPITLTSLGMFKSWFFFPLLYAFVWSQTGRPADRERLFACLFGGMLLVALGSLWYVVLDETTYDGRLQAWYASPNYLALYLSPAVLFATHFFFRATERSLVTNKFRRLGTKIFFGVSAALFIMILYATHSYGAWMAVGIAVGTFFFLRASSGTCTWRAAVSGLVVVALFFGIFFSLENDSDKWHDLVTFDERSSIASRAMIWRSAGTILADHLFIGIGLGRFQEEYLAYQQYFPPYLEWAVPQPHNLFLSAWLQTGLSGMIGFMGLLAVWMKRQRNAYQNAFSDPEKTFRALLISLGLLFIISGIADTPFFKNDLVFLWWTVLVAGAGFFSETKNDPSRDRVHR